MLTKMPGQVAIQDDLVIGRAGDRDLHGDLFLPPTDDGNRPGLLLIHGGAWWAGDRKQLRGYAIQMARFGFVCLCTEYRLSGEARWPAQIHDVKAALRWFRSKAPELNMDPQRIAVSGNSAGAHLALMLAATPNAPVFEGEGGNPGVETSVSTVVAIYPPTLLRKDNVDGAVAALLGSEASREVEDGASPITYVHSKFPPTLLVHGNQDTTVPVNASINLYQALTKTGAQAELHIYEGAPHAFDAVPDFGRQVIDIMALFLDRKLVNPRTIEPPATR